MIIKRDAYNSMLSIDKIWVIVQAVFMIVTAVPVCYFNLARADRYTDPKRVRSSMGQIWGCANVELAFIFQTIDTDANDVRTVGIIVCIIILFMIAWLIYDIRTRLKPRIEQLVDPPPDAETTPV